MFFRVKPGEADSLREALRDLQDTPGYRPGDYGMAIATIHEARFVLFDVGAYTVRGKAWSGTGPVTRVDVSLTGEGEWHAAQLEPPNGLYQWRDWSFEWDANDIGRQTLRARATDAAGNVQPEVPPWNRLGYGNNAIEVVHVEVR